MSLGRLFAQGKLIPCSQHNEGEKRHIPARFFVMEHEATQQITNILFLPNSSRILTKT